MNRLDIILQSLKKDELGKSFYNLVCELDVEDWIHIYNNIELYEGIEPFIIYTYNERLIEDISRESSKELVARVILNSWNAIFGDQENIEGALNTPCLQVIFNNHIYNIISNSGYDADIKGFILPTIKKMVDLFLPLAQSNDEALLAMVGGKKNIFPPLTEYNIDCVQKSVNLALLLASINRAMLVLGVEDDADDEIHFLLETGDIKEVLRLNSKSKKHAYRAQIDIDEIESYLASVQPEVFSRLHEMMLTDCEVSYIKGLYARGLHNNDDSDKTDNLNVAHDLSEDEPIDLVLSDYNDDGEPLICEPKAIANLSDKFTMDLSKIKSIFSQRNKELPKSNPEDNTAKEDVVSSATFECLVLNKKKKSKWGFLLYLFVAVVLVFWVVTLTGVIGKDSSATSKNQSGKGSEYSVITIYEE